MADCQRKFHLITRNLQECLGEEKLKEILETRRLKLYWGTATTGRPHLAYFVPISKIADFLRADCEVIILLADLHAYLDNMKAPWDLLKYRTQYYECIIKAMLRSIGVPIERLKFIKGTDYEFSREYTLDVYRLSSLVSQHDCKKAGAEVVKQVQFPLLSGLLYPCLQVTVVSNKDVNYESSAQISLQKRYVGISNRSWYVIGIDRALLFLFTILFKALDEQYLEVDAQFGGIDQRKIFTFAEKYLPMLNYKKRIHLMNPMVPGLTGSKMSASDEASKIDLLDSASVVEKKLKKAFCEPGNIQNNGLLAFAKHVFFPLLKENEAFQIDRSAENGGCMQFESYAELESAFASQNIHPADLKHACLQYINRLLEPIRKEFASEDMQELVSKAYSAAESTALSTQNSGLEKSENGTNDFSPDVLDLRVGRILSVVNHPSADSLYVEEIDVGEERPRTIVSNLAGYMSLNSIKPNSLCVVLCNVKPVKIRDVLSHGILIAAYSDRPKHAELIEPPKECKPGNRIWFEDFETDNHETELKPKKKVWEKIQLHLLTDEDCVVRWRNNRMFTEHGCVNCKTLSKKPVK